MQAAQEPLWLLHCSILPLVKAMYLEVPPRLLNVSHMCKRDPCSHQNRVTLLPVPLKQCTVYALCHRVCCKDGVGCRARNQCKCDITPRPTSQEKFPHGERQYMQERRTCQQTHPNPYGQGVFRTACGFKMKHMLKCCVRNLMPLAMWAAAQLSQSKLSGKLTGCLFA